MILAYEASQPEGQVMLCIRLSGLEHPLHIAVKGANTHTLVLPKFYNHTTIQDLTNAGWHCREI